MKKIIYLSWAKVVLLFCGILVLLLDGSFILVWLAFLPATFLSGVSIFYLYQQRNILNFLLAEQKKKDHYRLRDVYWEEEESQKLEVVKKRVELYTLQSQINPHFLYNTLDSIRGRALLDGNREIASMTEILSKFFRYCISHDESLVQIREEISHIQDYYYIQKYRFEERFDMELTVEQEAIYDYYIPKMTLQPLVENAMIHGLEKTNRRGLLKLQFIATEKKVVITVSDNGVGMSMEQLVQLNRSMEQVLLSVSRQNGHTSIAVTNINARIKLTFGEQYGIRYRSMEDEGTDAVITIPVIDDFSRARYDDRE